MNQEHKDLMPIAVAQRVARIEVMSKLNLGLQETIERFNKREHELYELALSGELGDVETVVPYGRADGTQYNLVEEMLLIEFGSEMMDAARGVMFMIAERTLELVGRYNDIKKLLN